MTRINFSKFIPCLLIIAGLLTAGCDIFIDEKGGEGQTCRKPTSELGPCNIGLSCINDVCQKGCVSDCALGGEDSYCEGSVIMECLEITGGCWQWRQQDDCKNYDEACVIEGNQAVCSECVSDCNIGGEDPYCQGSLIMACAEIVAGCWRWVEEEDCADYQEPCVVNNEGAFCQEVSDTCTNQVKDGNESDIDCGGPSDCVRCSEGQLCTMPGDCHFDMECLDDGEGNTRCAYPGSVFPAYYHHEGSGQITSLSFSRPLPGQGVLLAYGNRSLTVKPRLLQVETLLDGQSIVDLLTIPGNGEGPWLVEFNQNIDHQDELLTVEGIDSPLLQMYRYLTTMLDPIRSEGDVLLAGYSKDGQTVVTVSKGENADEFMIRFLDHLAENPIQEISYIKMVDSPDFTSLAVNPDGQYAVLGMGNIQDPLQCNMGYCGITVFNRDWDGSVCSAEWDSSISSIVFSDAGSKLALSYVRIDPDGNKQSGVRIYDTASEPLATECWPMVGDMPNMENGEPVPTTLSYAFDDQLLLSGGMTTGDVHVYRTMEMGWIFPIGAFSAHTNTDESNIYINDIDFTHDHYWLATAGFEEIIVFDMDDVLKYEIGFGAPCYNDQDCGPDFPKCSDLVIEDTTYMMCSKACTSDDDCPYHCCPSDDPSFCGPPECGEPPVKGRFIELTTANPGGFIQTAFMPTANGHYLAMVNSMNDPAVFEIPNDPNQEIFMIPALNNWPNAHNNGHPEQVAFVGTSTQKYLFTTDGMNKLIRWSIGASTSSWSFNNSITFPADLLTGQYGVMQFAIAQDSMGQIRKMNTDGMNSIDWTSLGDYVGLLELSPNGFDLAAARATGSAVDDGLVVYHFNNNFPTSKAYLYTSHTIEHMKYSTDSAYLAVINSDIANGTKQLSILNTNDYTTVDSPWTFNSTDIIYGLAMAEINSNYLLLVALQDAMNMTTDVIGFCKSGTQWNPSPGPFMPHPNGVEHIAISPDNQWFVTISTQELAVWDFADLAEFMGCF
jgi:WD40 repeat protein